MPTPHFGLAPPPLPFSPPQTQSSQCVLLRSICLLNRHPLSPSVPADFWLAGATALRHVGSPLTFSVCLTHCGSTSDAPITPTPHRAVALSSYRPLPLHLCPVLLGSAPPPLFGVFQACYPEFPEAFVPISSSLALPFDSHTHTTMFAF